MKTLLQRWFSTFFITTLSSFIFTMVVYAAINFVDEFSSKFTGSGLYVQNPCSYCNGNKGKYRSTMDGAGTGRWNASHNNTMTQWFVYIPNDTTRTLGGAYYTIANHVHQPPQIPVIQNNWKGQYVGLGWLDVGNNAYARMKNNCTLLGYCGNRIYWDIAKYNY